MNPREGRRYSDGEQPWVQEVMTAYAGYFATRAVARRILGEGNRLGEIDQRYESGVREEFYELTHAVRSEIPGILPLRLDREKPSPTMINFGESTLVMGLHRSSQYFLVDTNEVYRVQHSGFLAEEIPTSFYPESEDFMGIDIVRGLDYRNRPTGIYFDPVRSNSTRGELSMGEIEILLGHIEGALEESPNKELVGKLREKMEDLGKVRKKEWETEEPIQAEHMRKRILIIRDVLIKYFGQEALPEFLYIGTFSLKEDGSPDLRTYFLPREGRLVNVPEKERRILLLKTGEKVPDMKRAQDAELVQWRKDANMIASGFKRMFPKVVQDELDNVEYPPAS